MKTKEYTYEVINNISGVEIIDEPQNTNGISNIIKLIGVTYNKVSKLSKETEIKFGDYDTFIEEESKKISTLENSKASFVVQDGKVTFTQNDITAEVFTTEIYNNDLFNIHKRYDNIKNILFGDGNIEVENYPKTSIIGSIHDRLNTIEKLKDNIKNINNNSVGVDDLNHQPILSATVEQFNNIENILTINEDNLSISNNNTYNSLMKTNDIISFVKDISNKILSKIKSNKDNIDKNQKFLQGREDYYKCCAFLGITNIFLYKNDENNYFFIIQKNSKFFKQKIIQNDDYSYFSLLENETSFNINGIEYKKIIYENKQLQIVYNFFVEIQNKDSGSLREINIIPPGIFYGGNISENQIPGIKYLNTLYTINNQNILFSYVDNNQIKSLYIEGKKNYKINLPKTIEIPFVKVNDKNYIFYSDTENQIEKKYLCNIDIFNSNNQNLNKHDYTVSISGKCYYRSGDSKNSLSEDISEYDINKWITFDNNENKFKILNRDSFQTYYWLQPIVFSVKMEITITNTNEKLIEYINFIPDKTN